MKEHLKAQLWVDMEQFHSNSFDEDLQAQLNNTTSRGLDG